MVMCSRSRDAPPLDSDLFSECLLCTRRKGRPLVITQLQVKTAFGQEQRYSPEQKKVNDFKVRLISAVLSSTTL